uniref:Fibrinogen-like protein 1 n=1 Tax=Seriola dumerili TaxID=41447 RepID=A0A3B4TMI4_SERDU
MRHTDVCECVSVCLQGVSRAVGCQLLLCTTHFTICPQIITALQSLSACFGSLCCSSSCAHMNLVLTAGDCSQVFADGNVASGLYVIRPDGSPTALTVYCDMNNGGGWTVFQRRRDGKESFDRSWVEYKHGFGDLHSPDGEFWLGNDPLHYLTSQGNYDLRINMEDFEGNQRYAEYKNFKVDDEKVKQTHYQLHLEEFTGNAGDALADAHTLSPGGKKWANPGLGSSGVKFSTFDQPNNEADSQCVRLSKSGWWFSRCDSGNLNGHYYKGPYEAMTNDGVVWYTWHGWWYSIKSVVMMVRAVNIDACFDEKREY